TRASKDALHVSGDGLQNHTAPKRSRRFRSRRKSRNESAAAAARRTGKTVGAAVIVANVIAAVHRCGDSAVAFLHDRAEKIARISSAVQSRLRHARRVEAALGCESRFLRCVVKRADDKILAGMSAGSLLKSFVFNFQALHYFRPRNVRAESRQD